MNAEKGVTTSSRYLNKEEAKINKKKSTNSKKEKSSEKNSKDLKNSIIQSEMEEN